MGVLLPMPITRFSRALRLSVLVIAPSCVLLSLNTGRIQRLKRMDLSGSCGLLGKSRVAAIAQLPLDIIPIIEVWRHSRGLVSGALHAHSVKMQSAIRFHSSFEDRPHVIRQDLIAFVRFYCRCEHVFSAPFLAWRVYVHLDA